MEKEQIVKAFSDFVDKKYSDSEDTLRSAIKQEVNDHLKTKLELKNDPIYISKNDEEDLE